MGNGIIVAGQEFPVDARVVTWHESGWDATLESCIRPRQPCVGGVAYGNVPVPYTKRYSTRPALRGYQLLPSLDALKAVVHHVIVETSGTATAAEKFESVHNERGLSIHLMIDADGTIYQTLDLALMAYAAGEWNDESISISLISPGTIADKPVLRGREIARVKINDSTIEAYAYTPAQYVAFRALASALIAIFPRVPASYPRSVDGSIRWTTMPQPEARAFEGFVGRFHLTNLKWDPGPFDFEAALPHVGATIPIANDNAKAVEVGGFPVGPWGSEKLWHGGLHLGAAPDAEVRAVLAGTVIAARFDKNPSPIGSVNFVLIRHDHAVGAVRLHFFSLYMHLAGLTTNAPRWAEHAGAIGGYVVFPDVQVAGGEVIGHVGIAGPGDLAKPQLHFEIFSTVELFTEIATSPWKTIIGTEGGRRCDAPEILALAPTDPKLRDLVTYHVSEWTESPSWQTALGASAAALIAEQITPTIWWTAEAAARCALPPDGVVYHYHPLRFIEYYEQLRTHPPAAAPPIDRTSCATTFTLEDYRLGDAAPACPPKPE